MAIANISRCLSCHAIVNVNWSACFACHGVLPRRQTDRTWLTAYRELATVTNGLARDDPRFQPVCSALDRSDVAYAADDWSGFEQAVDEVKRIVHGGENHHG